MCVRLLENESQPVTNNPSNLSISCLQLSINNLTDRVKVKMKSKGKIPSTFVPQLLQLRRNHNLGKYPLSRFQCFSPCSPILFMIAFGTKYLN